MKKRKFPYLLFLPVFLFSHWFPLSGQERYSFHPPLDFPLFLSANFGELRPDHFHSGIDIRTGGTTGHPVYSIDEGYISRIKVQANGYGNSIYVAHPGGLTSVYGHLDRYREDIEHFVREVQYRRRTHQVDLYLEPDRFRLEKGELIAYSGNSGNTFGPHLHFEVRKTANQHPTNVLQYGFKISDHLPPRFKTLLVYPLDTGGWVNGSHETYSSQLVLENGAYRLPLERPVLAIGPIGISVEVYDYLDGAPNRCAIYRLEMYSGEELIYSHEMDEFSFSETRYVNAHMNYSAMIRTGIKAHRLHRLPNDRLRIYGQMQKDGILQIRPGEDTPIRIVAMDVAGNKSELRLLIRGEEPGSNGAKTAKGFISTMKYSEANHFHRDGISVDIPANVLYDNMDFTFNTSPTLDGTLSPCYHVGDPEIPLHHPFTLSVPATAPDPSLNSKLVFVTENEEDGRISAGGRYTQGFLVAQLDYFGTYSVALDTVAPVITPLEGSGKRDLSGTRSLKFRITDNLSEIDSYDGYIDNSWALFEYDLKNDLLTYRFDEERVQKGSQHELELYVSDERGNVNLYHSTFIW